MKRVLAEWGVTLPPPAWDDGLEEWEGHFTTKVPSFGVELTVNLANEKRKDSRQLYALLVTSKFAGALPHDLQFGESQQVVRPKLGHFTVPDKRYNALRGDTFRVKGTRLYGVAIYGPTKKLVALEVNASR